MASTPLVQDTADIGQGKTYNDAVKKYDAQHGTYADGVDKIPLADRFQENQMPEAPEPSPFTLGPLTPGGR